MSILVRASVLAAVLLLPAVSFAQKEAEPPTPEQVAQWVKELGDNDFDVRESASKKLWEAGEAAEEAVLAATKSGDAEVSRRANELNDKFRWGVYPNTPPKVLELITRYQAGDENARLALVREMFDAGASGCATLLKIARAEKDANFRRRLFGQIGEESSRAVPALLADGSFTNLETLLELSVAAEADAAMPSYAAYWLLRGKLDDAVARWKAEAAKPDGKRAWEVLAYLYRAKGDLPAARAAAEKTDRVDLVEEVLYQQGDWKALAKRPATNEYRRDVEAMGYKAAYQRLAGDAAGFDATLAELRKFGESRAEGDVEVWYAAKALFLNDRAADALALLAKKNYRPEVRFEVLAAQGRYREAFEAADPAKLKAGDPEKGLLEVMRARTLYQLGETDKAQAIFTQLAGAIQEGNETLWEERLVEVEYRLGLRELAWAHCTRVLAASKSPARLPQMLGKVFPGQGDEAAALWPVLRKIPGKPDNLPDPMKQIRDLFDGKATEKAITDLAATMEKVQGQVGPEEREARLLALATAASAAKHDSLARGFLEKAAQGGSAAALLRLADHLAANKEWPAAAGRYAEAWAKDRNDPLPLFLRGDALIRSGKEKEGALWRERARLLPLGNEWVRHEFADGLTQRGHLEEARRQRDLLVRLSQPGSFYAGDALRQTALETAERDALKAADLHEKAMLRALDVRISFQDGGAYVAVPGAVHRLRVRGLIAAGRFDDAGKEIAKCEAALPDDVELPCLAVPALEKAGRNKEADELFTRCRMLHEALCRDYPKSAREHNSVAWLSACCRRELGQGQDHAEKAAALAPQSAGYLDTLGEVYFQRGDKAKALAAARRCAELEPKVEYYKRQVKRIEAGDPKAPLPPQIEE
jgi:tetratricopeptide (TPR) repeat protein